MQSIRQCWIVFFCKLQTLPTTFAKIFTNFLRSSQNLVYTSRMLVREEGSQVSYFDQ